MRCLLCLVLIVLSGCSSGPDLTELKMSIRSASDEIVSMNREQIDKTNSVIDVLRENTAALNAIKTAIESQVVEAKPVPIEVKEAQVSPEAVVVDDESEPVSGKEVILQSTSTSSSDTVADDGVHFEVWTATWCGPCRKQKPVTVSVSNELGIPVKHWWDWDAYSQYAADSKIDELPTLCVVRRGKAWKRLAGPRSAAEIRAAVAEVQAMSESQLVASADDLTVRNKLPVVATRWGLIDLEEVNADGACQCERCVELRALKAEYLEKPEYQNIGRKVEPETF
jgi:thiol-disulfide isomerase/thioredoxin